MNTRLVSSFRLSIGTCTVSVTHCFSYRLFFFFFFLVSEIPTAFNSQYNAIQLAGLEPVTIIVLVKVTHNIAYVVSLHLNSSSCEQKPAEYA